MADGMSGVRSMPRTGVRGERIRAEQRGQIKTRQRVRDLAEVYTHEREVKAMLDLIPDMFPAGSIKAVDMIRRIDGHATHDLGAYLECLEPDRRRTGDRGARGQQHGQTPRNREHAGALWRCRMCHAGSILKLPTTTAVQCAR